ncbi:extracellular solute-binding protein [Lachnospiraceae bacterium ZAX-1]
MYTNLPKYLKVKNIILSDIQNGVYQPGDMIPSDNDLMKTFSISKSTITQALKMLSQEGYIVREQGKGSFVTGQSSKTVIPFFVCSTEHKEENFWNSIVESFNQRNPAYQIKHSFIHNNVVPLRDTLFKAFAGGNAPDIFSLDGPDVPYWAYMNSLQPLDDFVTDEFKDRFIPQIIHQGTYKGKLYHLGYNESTLCILYSKKLFKELNIVPPSDVHNSWSWLEFLDVCKIIKENTDIQYPLLMDSGRGLSHTQGEWITYSSLPFIMQNNGKIFNENCTKTSGYLNSPASVAAMDWLGKLYHTYGYTHMEDIHEQFPNNFAMSLSLPNAFYEVINDEEQNDIGILPLPREYRAATPHGGWGLCMSKQTQSPAACWEFIQYVFSIENQLKLNKYTGMPVIKDIYEVFKNFNALSNNTNILFSQLHDTSFTRPITPAYPFFSKTFTAAYVNIAKGGDAQQILDEAAYQIDDHLIRHNYFRD